MTARVIMKMYVDDVRRIAPDVKRYVFRHPLRASLPPPLPGAHVDVRLPDGRIRQYSLCGDYRDDTRYVIAVKREPDGRGGSIWMHDGLNVGDRIDVTAPRHNFRVAPGAARHVFVGGGVGVTSLKPMAQSAAARGEPVVFHYCVRSADDAIFIDELRASLGDALKVWMSREPGGARFDAASVLGVVQPGTHVYACGPSRLIASVKAATAGWPVGSTHYEVFQPTLDENFKAEPFELVIASSGRTLRVPADRSALDIVREAGHAVAASCELGVCGSCRCRYASGTVIHRDSILDINERQETMMLCVSRGRGSVTLDL